MDVLTAQARLARMTEAYSEPLLTPDDLVDCLAMSRLADASGRPPTDPLWTPTWDLNRGAAEGWKRKAGKVAGNYMVTADGATFHREQVVAHCERMAAQYQRKIASDLMLPGALAR